MVKDKDYISVRGLPSFYIKRWELKTNPSPSIKHTCTNHGAQCWYSHMIKRMKLHRLFSFPCRKMHLAAAKSNLSTNNHILFCSLCFCQPPLLIFFFWKSYCFQHCHVWMFRAAVTELPHLFTESRKSGTGILAFSGVPFTPRTEISIFLAATRYKMTTYSNVLSSFCFNNAH